jgi:16S rRNA (uracil1498-N3)-methyltransferase
MAARPNRRDGFWSPLWKIAMSERFFLRAPPVAGLAVLTGDEAKHLARVLRAKPGDMVTLFDGHGMAWPARVGKIGRSDIELETGEPLVEPAARGPRLTLAVALPKGERQKWLVEKLTELGVDRLVPLVTERGVAEATPSAIERLERGVIEACKQCGRNRLMEIGQPVSLAAVVADKPAAAMGMLADPTGVPLSLTDWQNTSEVIALVGPEGGFTDGERAAAMAGGFHTVSLGAWVLRVETAAIAMASTAYGLTAAALAMSGRIRTGQPSGRP